MPNPKIIWKDVAIAEEHAIVRASRRLSVQGVEFTLKVNSVCIHSMRVPEKDMSAWTDMFNSLVTMVARGLEAANVKVTIYTIN